MTLSQLEDFLKDCKEVTKPVISTGGMGLYFSKWGYLEKDGKNYYYQYDRDSKQTYYILMEAKYGYYTTEKWSVGRVLTEIEIG